MSARQRQQAFLASSDPEATLLEHIKALVDEVPPHDSPWRPGTPLKLLLAGYSGAGNVGTEMRAGEILRQMRHLLGPDVEFSALSMSSALPADVLPDVACLPLSAGYIPEVVVGATRQHHGTIACEGSMFKSTFANVLSAVMAGALAAAARGGKLSVGYGAEVARMDAPLEDFVRRQVDRSLILCRNEPSRRAAVDLGLRAAPGADTGWTVPASAPEAGRRLLKARGWNGHDPVLTVCPMNPFWWPVRPSPQMARELRRTGAHRERHYASLFFHAASPEIEGKYQTYLTHLGQAVRDLCRTLSAFPVIVAMERVDEAACRNLSVIIEARDAVVIGADYRVGDIVSMLRCSDLLLSSRFHALVGAMPAGIPSIGIAMDERIHNLFSETGQSDRVVDVQDPGLAGRLVSAARRLDRVEVRRASQQTVCNALRAMGTMGQHFLDEVDRCLPDLPRPVRPATWQAHIAPLPPDVEAFLIEPL